jgi:hypothetical protein
LFLIFLNIFFLKSDEAGPCYSLPLENSCIPALFSTATAATHLTIKGYKQSFSPSVDRRGEENL